MRISVEGAEPDTAAVVVVLLHGGGAAADDFLALSQEFDDDDEVSWLAPQALQRRWFPEPGSVSRRQQEPYLTVSSKSVLGLLENHAEQRIVLAGFADGASVVAELLCDPDLPRSVVAAWLASGSLVGPESEWPEQPKLAALPILVSGCHDLPEHAEDRLELTARFFEASGAKVSRYLYEGASFGIVAEELREAQSLLRRVRR